MKVSIIGASFVTTDGIVEGTASTICGKAAAICTDYPDPDRALTGALSSGHESVLEHASVTFKVEGVSRVLLAQLTRHRIASFSVQSQRYCRLNEMDFVVPECIGAGMTYEVFKKSCEEAFHRYWWMINSGVPEEDARYVLPQAVTCNLIMTMNVRELRHFFALRCCNRAQWEIREMADEMLKLCKIQYPSLFKGVGPGCVRGTCPEGKRACKKPRNNDDLFNDKGDSKHD